MKLSTAARSKLKASVFAGPNRSFPINDENHARAAITGASRSYNVGNIDDQQRAAIVAKAKAYLARNQRSGTER